jgi:uncharacterized membrane protein YfhO
VVTSSGNVIEHGTSRSGRWLRARRFRIALIIAAIEAVIVAVFHDVSRWTVIGVAVLAVALYVAAGRESKHDWFRQATWILAVSQLLAVVAAIFAFVVFWAALLAVGVFAIVALIVIFSDRK